MARPMKSIVVGVLIAALGLIVLYAFVNNLVQPRSEVIGQKLGDENKILTTERDFRDKITELRIQREKVDRGIKRLELRKTETLKYLKDKGIRSSADVTDDTDVTYALRNLKGWKVEIEKLQEDTKNYDEAISSIEVMLDELERKRINQEVALTEEEYLEMRKIVKDLNERLGLDKNDVLAEEELGRMLDEELEKDASGSGDN